MGSAHLFLRAKIMARNQKKFSPTGIYPLKNVSTPRPRTKEKEGRVYR